MNTTEDILTNIYRRRPRTSYARYFKRVLDFCLALLGLIAISPLLLLIILLLLLAQGGNPFFVQRRIGYHLFPFNVIKFRTMTDERGRDGELLPDEQRTTWVGKLLRATSLDELPELINVLRGDMSFIGPRPWVPEQMDTFRLPVRAHRMLVRPGISGLAQILGRNDLTFRQRVCCDLTYIRNLGLWLDTKILCYTFYKVIKREGIQQRPNALGKRRPNAPKDSHTRGLRGNKPGNQTAPLATTTALRHHVIPIAPINPNKK